MVLNKNNKEKNLSKIKCNNMQGITLVALVITIIVLIILAGVSISLVLGDNGIITKAKEAKEQHEMAQVKEKIETAILEIQTEEITIGREITLDTLLEKLLIKLPGIIISKEDNTLKGTYKGYDYTIDENFKVIIDGYNPDAKIVYEVTFNGTNVTSNGASTIKEQETYIATLTPTTGYGVSNIVVTMGDKTLIENTDYTYTNGTIEIPNVSGNIEINVVTNMITSILKAGDYIKYNTGVASVGANGVITCRVLYEASSEYGLQIISDKNVADVTLGGNNWVTGQASYNSAIQTLNKEAEKYLNNTYVTDARCVGSVPSVENGIFINKDSETTTPVTLKFTPSGWSTRNSGCKGADTNYITDQTQMINTNIWTTGEDYWLATRMVDSQSSGCYFYVCVVDTGKVLYNGGMCGVTSSNTTYGYSYLNGLRPCFSLKSDIVITGGDGTSEETAYTI